DAPARRQGARGPGGHLAAKRRGPHRATGTGARQLLRHRRPRLGRGPDRPLAQRGLRRARAQLRELPGRVPLLRPGGTPSPRAAGHARQDLDRGIRVSPGGLIVTERNAILMHGNPLKLAVFCANCSSGKSYVTAPERWGASWDENVELARLADEAGVEAMI